MDTLYTPNTDLYNILTGVDEGTVVYQEMPKILSEFPCITFSVSNNRANVNLDKDIAYQELVATIDIWTLRKKQGSELLSSLEETMRENNYQLDFSSELPADLNGVRHITTRFNLVR